MPISVNFTLSFEGEIADQNLVDFYDVAEALRGFQRSLAITTHLFLNDEIITQAPSLRNARILVGVPESGSWKVAAFVTTAIMGGAYAVLTAPKDTVLGNLIISGYDYILKSSLGINVDFNSTIGQQLESLKKEQGQSPAITPEKMDSAIEKCESAITSMHRPVVKSETATRGVIKVETRGTPIETQSLTPETYAYISFSDQEKTPIFVIGKISSYNINTFKGRIYSITEKRPIPFTLAEFAQTRLNISQITGSLNTNALDRRNDEAYVRIEAFRILSQNGRLKGLVVIGVEAPTARELMELFDT